MVIGPHTRISELVKHNEASIEAIASLAKPLRKLRNPLLRRVMASRVTIAEAASIGGCAVADFKRVLEPLGFTYAGEGATPAGEEAAREAKPDWLRSLPESQTDHFDVRNIIASGEDPLKAIMQRYKALPEGHVLCIVNSFIPYPLVNLLGKQGAQSFVETEHDQLHYTWFFKDATSHNTYVSGDSNVTMHGAEAFAVLLGRFDTGRIQRIDVRHLPMPQPMQTILETLPTLAAGEVLLVDHKRVPLHLLEELQESDYAVHIHEAGEGDVKVFIHPLADA